jgi:hypothetical protein
MAEQDNETSFSDVFGRDSGADSAAPATSDRQPRDEVGRFASKADDAPAESIPTAEPTPAEPVAPIPEEPAQQHRVPLREVLTEREKRRAAEDGRLQAEARAEAYERQLQQLMQQSRTAPQQAQQQPQQDDIPDPVLDPRGFVAYQQEVIRFQLADQNANYSEARAKQKFGEELVEAAKRAAVQSGLGQQFLYRPDPYEDVVAWYRKATILKEVGSDPDAWRQKVEQDIRAKVMEELKTKSSGIALPGSLAQATATGPQGGHIDMKSMASSVFARDGRR